MLILAKNSANTSVAAEKTPLIRDIEFAERERDLCLAYFSSFFPHFFVNFYTQSKHTNSVCQRLNRKSLH